jgi:hypothetical protein
LKEFQTDDVAGDKASGDKKWGRLFSESHTLTFYEESEILLIATEGREEEQRKRERREKEKREKE